MVEQVVSRRPGESTPDVLIRWFRWGLALVAAAHLIAFRELPAAVLVTVLSLSNGLDLVAHRLPRFRTPVLVAQAIADTGVAVWMVAVGYPSSGIEGTIWPLLLLPATETAVRFRLLGALATVTVGIGGVHLIRGLQDSPRDVAEQLVVLGAAIGIGLISEVLEARLQALSRERRETVRRAGLLTAVASAARRVTALDPQRVLEAVTEAALELGFDMAEICVMTDDDGAAVLTPVVQRGWPDHHPPASQPADSGVAGQAVQRGELVVVEDYQAWEHALPIHRATGIARSAATGPIREGDRIVAVLTVANHEPRQLTGYERDCLELLATQAGVALQNARTYVQGQVHQAELERRASVDALTRVANRDHAVRVLEDRAASGAAAHGHLTVLFVDLDDLKRVNDTHGHQAGDVVLTAVAQRMQAALRPEDTVARFGGDEFLAILDGAPDDIAGLARRILDVVGRPVEIDAAGGVVVPGVSIGAATMTAGEDVDGLLARADAAMYAAKGDPESSFVTG